MTAGWACTREYLVVVFFLSLGESFTFFHSTLMHTFFLLFFSVPKSSDWEIWNFPVSTHHFNSFAFNGSLINLFISKVTLSLSVLLFSWHASHASTDEKWAVQIVEEAANELKWMVKRRILMLSSALLWRRRMNFIILSHISLFPPPAAAVYPTPTTKLTHLASPYVALRLSACV